MSRREPTQADDASRDLIFVSMEDWDEVWRRNQFICKELCQGKEPWRILFVGLQRNLLRRLRQGDWRSVLRDPTWRVPEHRNVTVTTSLRVMPERFVWGRKLNEWVTRRHVRRVAASLGLQNPTLWLNPASAVHMAGKMGEKAIIYDITDDWEKLNQSEAVTAEVRTQDEALGHLADEVIVCSPALLAKKETKFRRRVHLVPNGVDAEHYRSVNDLHLAIPSTARRWAKPVLGYTGTIHPDRVDIALVAELAKRFAHGSVALVGPNLLDEADRCLLAGIENVHLPGAVPYRQIPDWMRAFDVCIVPHLVTEFTESLNPIKLWEYLAAGKPIVSTPVAGFRDYPTLVRLAGDIDTYTAEVNAALVEGSALTAARQSEARQHSWTSRVEQIKAIIEQCSSCVV